MTPTNLEKLERRQVAAGDLVTAFDLPVTDAGPVEQLASIGKFCIAPDVASSIASTHASAVYENASSENQALDVNQDGVISPADVDLIVQHLNQPEAIGVMPAQNSDGESDSANKRDVNADGIVSPADVLAVINRVHFYNSIVPCNCASCLASAVTDGI